MKDELTITITCHVSKTIVNERKKRGWSVYKLAKKSGVDAGHISRIENGFLCPRIDTLYKICNALKIQMQIPF